MKSNHKGSEALNEGNEYKKSELPGLNGYVNEQVLFSIFKVLKLEI